MTVINMWAVLYVSQGADFPDARNDRLLNLTCLAAGPQALCWAIRPVCRGSRWTRRPSSGPRPPGAIWVVLPVSPTTPSSSASGPPMTSSSWKRSVRYHPERLRFSWDILFRNKSCLFGYFTSVFAPSSLLWTTQPALVSVGGACCPV